MTDVIIPLPSPNPPPDLAAVKDAETAPGDGKVPWYKRDFYIGSGVKPEEVMNFSRQASSFLQAGIPILDALAIISEESASKVMTTMLSEIRRRLRSGVSLGDAIAQYPKVFPGYYIAMVRAAELTGQLDSVFAQLADYFERDLAARRQLKSALTYPIVVLCLAIVAVIAMAGFVLPKFKELYTSLNAKLPLPTRMLLSFTDFVQHYWWAILAGLALIAATIFVLFGGRHGKARRDALFLKTPVIGDLVVAVVIERFCRVLAALTRAGVSLPEAVQVSSDSTNNRVFEAKLAIARDAMMRGDGLSRPIAATGMFPAAARQMLRVGESTGTLEQQLHTAAGFYEREVTFRLKRVTDLFAPIVMVLVGGAVGFVAVAQVSAMYSIFSQVKA